MYSRGNTMGYHDQNKAQENIKNRKKCNGATVKWIIITRRYVEFTVSWPARSLATHSSQSSVSCATRQHNLHAAVTAKNLPKDKRWPLAVCRMQEARVCVALCYVKVQFSKHLSYASPIQMKIARKASGMWKSEIVDNLTIIYTLFIYI